VGFFYVIDKKTKIVACTCLGLVTPHDVVRFRQHIMLDSAFESDFSQLLDFTKATKIDISPLEARILAAISPFSVDSRQAMIFANHPQQLALFDLFEAACRFHGRKGVRRFFSQQEALDWISSKPRGSTLSKDNVPLKHSEERLPRTGDHSLSVQRHRGGRAA
jgi:hypothetical protein